MIMVLKKLMVMTRINGNGKTNGNDVINDHGNENIMLLRRINCNVKINRNGMINGN